MSSQDDYPLLKRERERATRIEQQASAVVVMTMSASDQAKYPPIRPTRQDINDCAAMGLSFAVVCALYEQTPQFVHYQEVKTRQSLKRPRGETEEQIMALVLSLRRMYQLMHARPELQAQPDEFVRYAAAELQTSEAGLREWIAGKGGLNLLWQQAASVPREAQATAVAVAPAASAPVAEPEPVTVSEPPTKVEDAAKTAEPTTSESVSAGPPAANDGDPAKTNEPPVTDAAPIKKRSGPQPGWKERKAERLAQEAAAAQAEAESAAALQDGVTPEPAVPDAENAGQHRLSEDLLRSTSPAPGPSQAVPLRHIRLVRERPTFPGDAEVHLRLVPIATVDGDTLAIIISALADAGCLVWISGRQEPVCNPERWGCYTQVVEIWLLIDKCRPQTLVSVKVPIQAEAERLEIAAIDQIALTLVAEAIAAVLRQAAEQQLEKADAQ